MNIFAKFLVVLAMGALIYVFVVVARPFTYFERHNDAVRREDLLIIAKVLDNYYRIYGYYPAASSTYMIETGDGVIPWGGAWSPYIAHMPKDPFLRKYVYIPSPDNNYQTYKLYASLQDPSSDPKACKGECVSVPEPNLCGGYPCNYSVSSDIVSP